MDCILLVMGGVEFVWGVFEGKGVFKVMLIVYMDMVYDSGILVSELYCCDGNLLYGLGIVDDKGGVVVILYVFVLLCV